MARRIYGRCSTCRREVRKLKKIRIKTKAGKITIHVCPYCGGKNFQVY